MNYSDISYISLTVLFGREITFLWVENGTRQKDGFTFSLPLKERSVSQSRLLFSYCLYTENTGHWKVQMCQSMYCMCRK